MIRHLNCLVVAWSSPSAGFGRRFLSGGMMFSGKSYLLPTVKLRPGMTQSTFSNDIESLVKRAPKVFEGASVVLDGSEITDSARLRSFVDIVRAAGLVVAGVTGVSPTLAAEGRLPLLSSASRASVDAVSRQQVQRSGSVAPVVIHRGHVRGGQQVYGAPGGGVTVIGSVHPGGEVIADGDVHVLGTLNGRALAGVSGRRDAVIVAQQFGAQLVSIADVFTICEDLPATVVPGQPTVVRLVDRELTFSSE